MSHLSLPPHIRDETLAQDRAFRDEFTELLGRNLALKQQTDLRLTLLMGAHSRAGKDSAIRTALVSSPLFDPRAVNLVFDFAFPPIPLPREILRKAGVALRQHHREEQIEAPRLDRTESQEAETGEGEKSF